MQLYHVQSWAEHTLNLNKTGQKGQQTVRVPSKDPRAQAFTGVQDLYVTCRQNMYTIRTLAAAGGNPKDASDQEKLRENVLPCLPGVGVHIEKGAVRPRSGLLLLH